MSTTYPGPLHRPSWRGRTNVDALTILAIEAAEKRAGFTFSVTQGSYQNTVAASAGTHSGGGVVDLSSRYLSPARKAAMVLALREVGFAAWLRTPAQGPWVEHVHAVLAGHPLLSTQAAAQVRDYSAGLNGLANRGRDDGPRVSPIPVFAWPTPPKELPKRVTRYLSETVSIRKAITAEVKRLKAAREVAKRKGEPLAPFNRAITRTKRSRKALVNARKAARKVQKR